LKDRIVLDGQGDSEKDFLRKDSPTMAVDYFRCLISIAAERGWTLASLDIKAAYLQAKAYNRLVFVKPPKEEGYGAIPWLLMTAAYGLIDSGRLQANNYLFVYRPRSHYKDRITYVAEVQSRQY
jgi:Reverse transcriptase (RNA-dependent DNA polymerase)/Mu DNA binding, I gamma subdomain